MTASSDETWARWDGHVETCATCADRDGGLCRVGRALLDRHTAISEAEAAAERAKRATPVEPEAPDTPGEAEHVHGPDCRRPLSGMTFAAQGAWGAMEVDVTLLPDLTKAPGCYAATYQHLIEGIQAMVRAYGLPFARIVP